MLPRNQCILLCMTVLLLFSGVLNAECKEVEISNNIQTLDIGGVDSPIIEWSISLNATVGIVTMIDAVYTGQTETTYASANWVNDSDGIDTVFYQYAWGYDGDWMNRTPTLLEGNSTHGRYSYTFTQSIWWDYQTSRPQFEGGSSVVSFRIFANDTLGNWRTTPANAYSYGFMQVYPPNDSLPALILGVALVFGVASIVIVAVRRRNQAQ